MKLKLTAIIFLLGISIQQQCKTQTNMETENSFIKYYPFDNIYFDLDSLTFIETDVLLAKNFKTESQYSFKFYAPSEWQDNFYQSVTYKNKVFTLVENHIEIKDSSTKEMINITTNTENIGYDNVVGKHFLVATKTGVIEVQKLEGENGYRIFKIDEQGNIILKINFEHTSIVKKGNTYHHYPYLYYFTCTNEFMVFTSYDQNIPKTVLVNLLSGEITEFNKTFSGVIRTDNEDNISGFIEIFENNKGFETTILNHKWKNNDLELWSNRAETVLIDDVLYISFYHNISTGSSLYAFDINSGELLWQAEVNQLLVGHSEYYNTVNLSAYKDKIIMEGIEAYGHFFQIFDSKTGNRVFSSF